MSDLPKMMSKREIELEELEEAKYVQSLRDDIEKLQEQLNTAKKALKEIAEFDCSDDCYSTAYEALMEIEEDFQKNIFKANEFIEEQKKIIEGSGDE